MTTQLPQLHEGRDGPKEQVKLINQLRRNLPGPAMLLIPVGPINLLSGGQTLAIAANANGWVTTFVDLVPDVITGAQSSAPDIRIGSNATFDDVVPSVSLGTTLVVNERVPLTLVSPVVSLTNDIYIDILAGSGPSVLTATVYLSGYYR